MSDSALPLSRLEHLSSEVGNLCRGEPSSLIRGFENQARTLAVHCFIIITCASVYGATTGLWRVPLQALYTAAKFTLVILITTVGNAFLNGMIAQLMGMKIGVRWILFSGTFAVVALDHRSVLFHSMTLRAYFVESVRRFRYLLNRISVYGSNEALQPAHEVTTG